MHPITQVGKWFLKDMLLIAVHHIECLFTVIDLIWRQLKKNKTSKCGLCNFWGLLFIFALSRTRMIKALNGSEVFIFFWSEGEEKKKAENRASCECVIMCLKIVIPPFKRRRTTTMIFAYCNIGGSLKDILVWWITLVNR